MFDDVYYIYGISFLVFLAVITLIEGGYLLLRAIREEGTVKISQRLKSLSAGGEHHRDIVNILRKREMSELPFLNRILIAIPRLHALDRLLEQTDVNLTVSRFMLAQIGLGAFLVLLLSVLANVHIAAALIIGVPVGLVLPVVVLMQRRARRHKHLSAQLPDALDYIARSLRAGNPFSASLKSVARDMPEPLAKEFGITFEEMNYGIDFEEAMEHLGHRTGSEEMNYFITAVLIQRTTGGNLADILNNLAKIMRARASTFREIRILSAEMRMSANVLILLPFFVAGIVMVGNPGYLDVLFDTTLGNTMIIVQLVLLAVGYYTIRKMVNFRV